MPTNHLALRATLIIWSIFAIPSMADEEFQNTSLLMESEALAAETAASELGEVSDDCCCRACYGPSWVTGVEMTFMGYDARTGGRINLSYNDSSTAGVDYSIRDGNNSQGLAYTPRIWFGRQFGEIIKDLQTVTIPYDHDVGQPNLWGEGGVAAKRPDGSDGV